MAISEQQPGALEAAQLEEPELLGVLTVRQVVLCGGYPNPPELIDKIAAKDPPKEECLQTYQVTFGPGQAVETIGTPFARRLLINNGAGEAPEDKRSSGRQIRRLKKQGFQIRRLIDFRK